MDDVCGRIVANESEADDAPSVQVEFFGLARERAGVATIALRAKCLSELLRAVERMFPRLEGQLASILSGNSSFRVSLNGERFPSADEALRPGAKILVLSGDAGG